jgi:hypothetical protein
VSVHQLWLIKGTGHYWSDFYVPADDAAQAAAKASDILAGADGHGNRFYNTAELEIMSVTPAGLRMVIA